MNTITIKGYGKVNIGLDVLRRREDGYHELRTIMQSVGIYDTLTITKTEDSNIHMTTNVSALRCDASNLVVKAAQLMQEEYHLPGGMQIHLDKNIPMAAGMAGGSTDAAAILRGVNALYELKATKEDLCKLGVRLGADVPFCVLGGTVLAEGIGEKLTVMSDIENCHVLIVKPDFGVSTKYVYENLHANELKEHPDIDAMIVAIEGHDIDACAKHMGNVLETVTRTSYPQIEEIKHHMMELGAIKSMMSGSGSTVFGLYYEESVVNDAIQKLREIYPSARVMVTNFVGANM